MCNTTTVFLFVLLYVSYPAEANNSARAPPATCCSPVPASSLKRLVSARGPSNVSVFHWTRRARRKRLRVGLRQETPPPHAVRVSCLPRLKQILTLQNAIGCV